MKKITFLLIFICAFNASHAQNNASIETNLRAKYGKVELKQNTYHDESDKSIIETYYIVGTRNNYGICDAKGKELLPPGKYANVNALENLSIYDYLGVTFFYTDNFCIVGLWDVAAQNMAIPEDQYYFMILASKETRKTDRVLVYRGTYQKSTAGIFNLKTKKEEVPVIYNACDFSFYLDWSDMSHTSDFLFSISDGDYSGLLDKKGKVIVSLKSQYEYFNLYYDNGVNYICAYKQEKIALLDEKGKTILPAKYKQILTDIPYVLVQDSQTELWGIYIYTTKKWASQPQYTFINSASDETNQIYEGEKTNGQKDIYHNGKLIMQVDEFQQHAKEHIHRFRIGKQWGYFDGMTGKIVGEGYDSAEMIEDGVAMVSKDGQSFLLTKEALLSGGGAFASMSAGGQKSDVDIDIPIGSGNRENTFAVIIANGSYENIVNPYAINDGTIMKEYFIKTLQIPASNIIYYENATLNNFHAIINRLQNLAEVYEDGCSIIFYYTGLGAVNESSKESFFYPTDGTLKAISSTCYSTNRLYSEIGDLPNLRQAVFLIDASFNGLDREGNPFDAARGVALKAKQYQLPNKLYVLEAAADGETARDLENQSHGVFTYYLLKNLQQSKGKQTINEIYHDVYKKVLEKTTREGTFIQHPVFKESTNASESTIL